MRNLVVLADRLRGAPWGTVAAIATNHQVGRVYALCEDGLLLYLDNSDDNLRCYHQVRLLFEGIQEKWFKIDYVAAIASLVCVSQEGSIVTIPETDELLPSEEPDQIGVIENGISSAAWNPDFSCLVLVTNNDTMMMMSVTWDVLAEVPAAVRIPNSPTTVSWKGDGDMLAVFSTDIEDSVSRLRLYNRNLEVITTARNVADGPASVIKGLGRAMVFAPNGSFVAVHQQRVAGHHQVAFIEKNGLRHAELDLQAPPTTSPSVAWEVQELHWDPSSAYLAVLWSTPTMGCLHIYTRSNFQWSLKQQFVEPALRMLGFDAELSHRAYLHFTVDSGEAIMRTVDFSASVYALDASSDHPICVVNGAALQHTPLGLCVVPPPMSLTTTSLAAGSVPRHMCFVALPEDQRSEPAVLWCQVVLASDRGVLDFLVGGGRSAPRVMSSMSLPHSEHHNARFRSVTARVFTAEGRDQTSLLVALACSVVGEEGIVWLQLDLPSLLQGTCSVLRCVYIDHVPGSIHNLHYPLDGSGTDLLCGVQAAGAGGSEFHVYAVPIDEVAAQCSDEYIQMSWVPLEPRQTLPEVCPQFCTVAVHVPGEDAHVLTIALSLKHHLYINDVCVHLSVSSFVVNPAAQIVFFATTHARPAMHSVYLPLLCTHMFKHVCTEDEVVALVGMSDRRPVERGARLVGNLGRGTKVCIQLPRGNLEVFEPRALIYIHICSLLLQHRDCYSAFVLIRRQKVNFNLLLSPALLQVFMREEQLSAFTQTLMAKAQIDFLTHFITSLEGGEGDGGRDPLLGLAQEMYPAETAAGVAFLQQHDCTSGAAKVALVCQRLRLFLLKQLDAALRDGAHCATAAGARTALANAVLTTFAKEKRVAESFAFIKALCHYQYFHAQGGAGQCKDYDVSAQVERLDRQLDPSAPLHVYRNPLTALRINPHADEEQALLAALQDLAQAQGANVQVSLPHCIKYLSFLHDSAALFDRALLLCDFGLARLFVYHHQLDPRACMPLINQHEALAQQGSLCDLLHMRLRVCVHLQNTFELVIGYVHLCKQLYLEETCAPGGAVDLAVAYPQVLQTLTSLLPRVAAALKTEKAFFEQFKRAFQSLETLLLSRSAHAYHSLLSVTLAQDVVNAYYQATADQFVSSGAYQDAVHTFLLMRPPHLQAAIGTALDNGNYSLAMYLATSFNSPGTGRVASVSPASAAVDAGLGRRCEAVYSHHNACAEAADLTPLAVAQKIVAAYRDQQETLVGLSSDFVDVGAAVSDTTRTLTADPAGQPDTCLLVATLARDVAKDLEGAIGVLCYARRFLIAAEWCCAAQRSDLYDEVLAASRHCAGEACDYLDELVALYTRSTQHLAEIWKEPAKRLEGLSGLDATLTAAMKQQAGEAEEEVLQESDTASLFSAASAYSNVSRLSSASRASHLSSASSGSTVSILSQVSDSKRSITSEAAASTSFSIEGLDHSLLSRGKLSPFDEAQAAATAAGAGAAKHKREHKRDQSDRRKKRIERSKAKGYMKDIFGTRQEQDACEALWKCVRSLPPLRALLVEITTLMLSSRRGTDRDVATRCQQAMGALVERMQASAPPYAPLYPMAWLQQRQMECVRGFQAPEQVLAAIVQRRAAALATLTAGVAEGSSGSGTALTVAAAVGLLAEDAKELHEVHKVSWFAQCAGEIERWFAQKVQVLQRPERCTV